MLRLIFRGKKIFLSGTHIYAPVTDICMLQVTQNL